MSVSRHLLVHINEATSIVPYESIIILTYLRQTVHKLLTAQYSIEYRIEIKLVRVPYTVD